MIEQSVIIFIYIPELILLKERLILEFLFSYYLTTLSNLISSCSHYFFSYSIGATFSYDDFTSSSN